MTKKYELLPFDFKKALEVTGCVVTRDGRAVSEIGLLDTANMDSKLIVVIDGRVNVYYENGRYLSQEESHMDLFIKSEIIVDIIDRYANVYERGYVSEFFLTKENADQYVGGVRTHIARLCWVNGIFEPSLTEFTPCI